MTVPRKKTQQPETVLDTATADLDELQRQVAEAEERAAQARAVIAERQAQAERRRAEALREYDEQIVAAYTEERARLRADETEALQRLREAVVADPVWGAIVDYRAAQYRQYRRASEVQQASGRLGRGGQVQMPPGVGQEALELFLPLLNEAAASRARDEDVEREAEREAAGDRAAAEG